MKGVWMALGYAAYYWLDLVIELAASLTTLVGMWLGSTTAAGACWYIAAAAFWFALMFRGRIWGLAPLNVVALVVACLNLHRAL